MAVLVALILPPVLLGFSALAVDVGSMYVQRRQLQTSADAAALAAVGVCATTTTCNAMQAGQGYAAANTAGAAGNATGQAADLCGTVPSTPALPACSSPPPAAWVGSNTYVRATVTSTNTPLLRQVVGGGNASISAQSVAVLRPYTLTTARAPFAICATNTDSLPVSQPYGWPGVPLLTGSYPSYTVNPDAVGKSYPIWDNGNGNGNAVTNKCGETGWKGWMSSTTLHTLPGYINLTKGSVTSEVTKVVGTSSNCQVSEQGANAKLTGDCQFVMPICTPDNPPGSGDLWCPTWGAFKLHQVTGGVNNNGIFGTFLGQVQVLPTSGSTTTTPPSSGAPYVVAPSIAG